MGTDDSLKPDAIFPLTPGQKIVYDNRVRIEVSPQGELFIDGRSDPKCLEFHYSSGVGCTWRCFAVRTNGSVKIFRGSTTGPTMLDRNEVLAACR